MARHGTPVRARFSDDSKGLAHWVARKLNNHDPMRDRLGKPIQGLNRHKLGFVVGTDQKTVRYALVDGRQFLITVHEILPEDEVSVEPFVHA